MINSLESEKPSQGESSHEFGIRNQSEARCKRKQERFLWEEMKALIRSKQWAMDVTSLLKRSVQPRLCSKRCGHTGCDQQCDVLTHVGDSFLVRMLNILSAELYFEGTDVDSPTVFISDLNESCNTLDQRNTPEVYVTGGNTPSSQNQEDSSSQPQIAKDLLPGFHHVSQIRSFSPKHISGNSKDTCSLSETLPTKNVLGSTLIKAINLEADRPAILGRTKYVLPENTFSEDVWSNMKQVAYIMRQSNKDDASVGTALAKGFFDNLYSDEEILNSSQRQQIMVGSSKLVRAFDPTKKELILSATAFLLKNPESSPAEFIDALKNQSENLKLCDNLRRHLHTRVFSKHAYDRRKQLTTSDHD